MDNTHNRHYLPPTAEHAMRWINTKGWHKVIVPLIYQKASLFQGMHGRILSWPGYVLLEDDRDVTIVKLRLK